MHSLHLPLHLQASLSRWRDYKMPGLYLHFSFHTTNSLKRPFLSKKSQQADRNQSFLAIILSYIFIRRLPPIAPPQINSRFVPLFYSYRPFTKYVCQIMIRPSIFRSGAFYNTIENTNIVSWAQCYCKDSFIWFS